MAKRATSVSISNLSKSIDKAVALAGKRHGVNLGSDTIIYNWEILGRILRERTAAGASDPLDVAKIIAQGAGLKGTPVVTKLGREILVGVIPREFNVRF